MRVFFAEERQDRFAPYFDLYWKDEAQQHEIWFGKVIFEKDAQFIMDACNSHARAVEESMAAFKAATPNYHAEKS